MADIIKLSATPASESCRRAVIPGAERPLYWEIPILFEDEDLLILDKPSGVLTSQSFSTVEAPNLLALLRRDIQRTAGWAAQRQLSFLDCVYLLDEEVSGVLIFTKNKPAQNALSSYLGSEKPFRVFHALVHGIPEKKPERGSKGEREESRESSFRAVPAAGGAETVFEEFRVHAGLMPHPKRSDVMKVDIKRGKKAITFFRVLEGFNSYSYVECRPMTERFLQIRAHLRYLRTPIVADPLYAGRPLYLSSLKPKYHPSSRHDEKPLMGRVALHCLRAEIPHPRTGEILTVEAPLPKDFNVSLKMLRRFGTRRWSSRG